MTTVAEVVDGVPGAKLRSGDPSVTLTGVTYDSRKVEPGALFIALSGDRFDGHGFVAQAIEAGAVAVLLEEGRRGDWPVPVIEVPSTRVVLAEVGQTFYGDPSAEMLVLGVTGTNGKTTCTYLLESLLQGMGLSTGVIGTVEYRWPGGRRAAPNTTPDGLVLQGLLRRMADAGVEAVVMEVSSHGLASGRVRGVRFAGALFTNLSQDHLDFHGSMEEYRDAKWRLFREALPRSGGLPVAAINVDDAAGRGLVEELRRRDDLRTLSYGFRAGADVEGEVLESRLEGVSFWARHGAVQMQVRSPLPGLHNGENLLGSIALTLGLGFSSEQLAAALDEVRGVPGRMERVVASARGPGVFVDYAHTPDALERALAALKPLVKGELVVVFGCGGDRDRGKRPLMGQIAERWAHRVVVTSDNPRMEGPEAIIAAILEGMKNPAEAEVFVDRREAIQHAIGTCGEDDAVLIAGKGHETYQEVGRERRDFDDREEAARALAERRQE